MVTTHLAFFFFNGMGGGGDVTLALEGSQTNSAHGTLVPSTEAPVSGLEILSDIGELTAEGGDVPQAPSAQRGRRGRRIRIIEDPERLEEEICKEEKILEKDKKKLVVLFKQQAKAEGFLYQQIEQKIEKLEARVDDRMQKIAELIASMPEIEDDEEEEMFLLDS